MKTSRTRAAMLAVILALAVGLLPAASYSSQVATPIDLFFSEYIEGSSNNKALEIYNGTGAAVDLAAGGYNTPPRISAGSLFLPERDLHTYATCGILPPAWTNAEAHKTCMQTRLKPLTSTVPASARRKS